MKKYLIVSLLVNAILASFFVVIFLYLGILSKAAIKECFSIMFIVMTLRSLIDYYKKKGR